MNLLKIGNFTINLDTVTHWVEIPKSEYMKAPRDVPPSTSPFTPFHEPSDDPIVIIHHVGPKSPFVLNPVLSRAFVAYMRDGSKVSEVQLNKPGAPVAGS